VTIATRGTIVYTPTAADLVRIYLELFEVILCFTVAIVKELFNLTAQAVRFCQAWQDWRWQCFIGPVDLGFDLQQDWDDLEVVWFLINRKESAYGVYWCRQSGWVKVDW
jgi:hypothetical protein